jgi:glycosyltransferase involved in cell wall biosynthesis
MASRMSHKIIPLVSVVLPVYSRTNYLSEAIESILGQTLRDIELIIIEDPKHGKFENELTVTKYSDDPRLTYIKNERREGLVGSLNKAISLAKSEYVARQDADDVSLPNRLALQYESLKQTPSTVIGGNMIVVDDNGEIKGYRKYPARVSGGNLILSNVVAHPTVMFEKKAILALNGYDPKMVHVEDYDLWIRLADSGHKIYNLSEYLIKYRHHKEAIKFGFFKTMLLHTLKLQLKSIRKYRSTRRNILFPFYFFSELIFLVLPKRIGYYVFEKAAVRSNY